MTLIPKGIVVHSMSEYIEYEGEVLYAKDFLKKIGLSVHGFITVDGKYDKMLPTTEKAAHAGQSVWGDYKGLNSSFIGFEILVKGINDYPTFLRKIQGKDAYSELQFYCAVEIVKWWMKEYNISSNNVIRHSDCSGDAVRGVGQGKKDPGAGFDWELFKKEISK